MLPAAVLRLLLELKLCQFVLLAAIAALVDVFRRALQLRLLQRRGQQIVAEREHAEAEDGQDGKAA